MHALRPRPSADGLSAGTIADIARDGEGFENRLAAFRDAEQRATEAEAKARERIAAAEAAEARSRSGLQDLADKAAELDERERRIAERERHLDRVDAGSKERSAAVGERENRVAAAEADLARLRVEAVKAVKALLS